MSSNETQQVEGALDYEEEAPSKVGVNPVGVVLFALFAAASAAFAWAQVASSGWLEAAACLAAGLLGSGFAGLCPRVANEWERAVILRLGRFQRLRGPGLFFVIPFIDKPVMWIDLRVRTTSFAAEKTLTADTVPVDVDAVLFWQVNSAQESALAVEDYRTAVSWAAQTALRDVIGRTHLADMLTGREAIDDDLRKVIDERTHAWGIVVNAVEIRDVSIPPGLEDAMSRQAQAEREKRARVILGDAEVEIAVKFAKAAEQYATNPTAFQLRAMNIVYEGIKEKGSLMVVPSGMMESLSAGSLAGLANWNRAPQAAPTVTGA